MLHLQKGGTKGARAIYAHCGFFGHQKRAPPEGEAKGKNERKEFTIDTLCGYKSTPVEGYLDALDRRPEYACGVVSVVVLPIGIVHREEFFHAERLH